MMLQPALTPELRPGQIINPVTGDRMTIIHSTRNGNGDHLKVLFDLPPGAKGSPLHYHDAVNERFEVLSGSLEMEVGARGNRKILRPGDVVEVAARMHHSFCNSSSEWVTFTSEMQPGAGFEKFLLGWYGLAIDDQVNQEGVPTNPLKLALLVEKANTIIVGQPLFVQKIVLRKLAQAARFLGVEKSLTKYWQ